MLLNKVNDFKDQELKDIVSDKKIFSFGVEDIYKVNLENLKNIEGVIDISIDNNNVIITSAKEVNNISKIIKEISNEDLIINDIGFKEITLETVFLSLTGKKLRD